MHRGRPVQMSNRAPCRGHSIDIPASLPSVSGCPSCEQTSSTAYTPSATRNSSTARSSNSSDFLPPTGISSSVATFSKSDMLQADSQFSFDSLAECFANGLHRDAVIDAVKETFDDHVHRLVPREPAAHAIED